MTTESEKTQNFNADALKALDEDAKTAKESFAAQRLKDEEEASRIARNRTKSAGGKLR